MTIDLLPNKISSLDCRQVAISNILKYKKYPEINTVWKNFDLSYEKRNNNELGNLFANRLTNKEELNWLHGIELVEIYENNEYMFVDNVKQLLYNQQPVMVFTDVFSLKYHSSYQKNHGLHVITLINFNIDKFICVDHYQQYIGEINIDELIDEYSQISYMFLETKNAKSILSKGDYKEVIETTSINLMGDVNISSEKNPNIFVGIQGIQNFIDDIKSYQEIDPIFILDLFDKFSDELGKLSFRHYQFSDFLREGVKYISKINSILDQSYDLAQEWRIITNMCLKGKSKEPLEMYSRVLKKLEEVYFLEENFLHSLFQLSKNI